MTEISFVDPPETSETKDGRSDNPEGGAVHLSRDNQTGHAPAISQAQPPATDADPYSLQPMKAALAAYEPQIRELLDKVRAVQIVDDVTNADAVAMAGQVKKLAKALEAKRKEIVQPSTDFSRSVNALVKEITERLGNAETFIKRQMAQYHKAQELKRLEDERKAQEAAKAMQAKLDAQAKDLGVPAPVLEPIPEPPIQKTVRTESGTSTVKKFWTFEIENEADIPREYLMIDEKKIRQAVKDGVRQIPGVRIFQDSNISIRS